MFVKHPRITARLSLGFVGGNVVFRKRRRLAVPLILSPTWPNGHFIKGTLHAIHGRGGVHAA